MNSFDCPGISENGRLSARIVMLPLGPGQSISLLTRFGLLKIPIIESEGESAKYKIDAGPGVITPGPASVAQMPGS